VSHHPATPPSCDATVDGVRLNGRVERDPEVDAALSALLDPRRLAVAGALVPARRTVDELVDLTALPRSEVLQALGTLRQVGLVDQVVDEKDDADAMRVDAVRALATAVRPAAVPMDRSIGYGMTDDERTVLSRFFRGRTLTAIPTERSKRLVVLERLALEFDVGRRYDEPEVNAVLAVFHPDVAALRRYLVDEEMLDRRHRDDGVFEYWRVGGRVPTT
jgi:hypothetical protein